MSIRLLFLLAAAAVLHGETGYNAWLRYDAIDRSRAVVPAVVSVAADSLLENSAQKEIIRGLRGMTGHVLRAESGLPKENAIVLGTLEQIAKLAPQWHITATLAPNGYYLKSVGGNIVVAGADERGVLYGAFALLRKIALGEPIAALDERSSPYSPLRWVNEWNYLDGTIERGYGGRSIYWEGLKAREDLSRVNDYGRMLASLGINACSINNVNANPRVLAPEFLPEVVRVA